MNEHQIWERDWWGTCQNTFNEERKQLIYAELMGLSFEPCPKTPYNINMRGQSVLDIGAGPCSMLLKCINVKGVVADPLKYPDWVYKRYKSADIEYWVVRGEDIKVAEFDEVWIYNVLQHVDDPELIIKNALASCKLLRLFEWINTPPTDGHPHTLTENNLNTWLGGEGKTTLLKDRGLNGMSYHGIFIGGRT
jgi:2-polyprenyl-3-methyl-5-hydroxy-6-metoxy-1,4-benzoquinol methylase